MEALLLLLAALSRVVVSNSVIGGIYREGKPICRCSPFYDRKITHVDCSFQDGLFTVKPQ